MATDKRLVIDKGKGQKTSLKKMVPLTGAKAFSLIPLCHP